MRIALATHSGRVIGGVESYLALLAPALISAGHELALWYDRDGSATRPSIVPESVLHWSPENGFPAAAAGLRGWKPDVVFSHGLGTPESEHALLGIAPGVFFAHAYYGACISGWKSRLSPRRAPCTRPLGVGCLFHYLPRRCGGLNPRTMARLYRRETRRRDLLHEFSAIVTASNYMREEYMRHGLAAGRVHVVQLPVADETPNPADGPPLIFARDGTAGRSVTGADIDREPTRRRAAQRGEWRLALMARLSELKGSALLLDALRFLATWRSRPITLTIIGDGPERGSLEQRARRLRAAHPGVTVQFTGWLDGGERTARLREADLLVVPSVWPEPFGLVGVEAGLLGIPAVAFAVGGIPDWLEAGVNGELAPGERPDAKGLATAIARALDDPQHHARLRAGAIAAARRFTMERHLAQLLPILANAAASEATGS